MYGLLGYPLGHSFSAQYFAGKLDYQNFEYKSVEEFIKSKPKHLQGFNVTIPYKQGVIEFLDEISDEAKAIGAVNCVNIRGGKMVGYNTDYYGFRESLERFLDGTVVDKAIVFGNGGASKAIQYALSVIGIDFIVVSRHGEVDYDNLSDELLRRSNLLVNTTSLGMSPNVNTCVDINYDVLSEKYYLYDIVYNPEETEFLKRGKQHGCVIKNGLEMLHLQADKSFEIWTL